MATSPDSIGGPWTVRRLLRWAAHEFADNGIDSPRLTAEILLAHCLGLPRIRLYTAPDHPLTPEVRDHYRDSVRRRLEREPLAYITGAKEFWGLEFRVSPDVLIPRPDTERLVETVVDILPPARRSDSWRILELGTGSGAIVAALAGERPGHRYFAMDSSHAALLVARRNAERLHPGADIDFFCGDWMAPVGRNAPAFHVIVSNPPYIERGEWPMLSPEIANHEPSGALYGGHDGLDAYRAILSEARRHLRPDGYLFLEIGYRQRAAVEAVADRFGGYGDAACFADLAGHDRVLRLRKR
jgi:release factor glutamine methyltransferase